MAYPSSMNSHFVQKESRASTALPTIRWPLPRLPASTFFLCHLHRINLEYETTCQEKGMYLEEFAPDDRLSDTVLHERCEDADAPC